MTMNNMERQKNDYSVLIRLVIVMVLLLIIALTVLIVWKNRRMKKVKPISDSWEEIIAAGKDGSYIKKYQIGNTKELDLGEEGVIEMELVAFNADELSDGSGKAYMTWIAKDLLNTKHAMNKDQTNAGGWPESEMRTWLRESILPLFPDALRSNIMEVKKDSYSYSDSETISSSDTIWIPSGREINETHYYGEYSGPEYKKAFPDDASRVRYDSDSHTSWWWLRSASGYSGYYFGYVYDDGSIWFNYGANNDNGVVIGFCLGSSAVRGTISDSWEEIIASGEDGSYIEKYRIGDTKELDLGEEGVIEMELVAFDTDELADGTGKAHMTWIAKNLINTEQVMNTEDTNTGGWPESRMRTWLRDSVLPLFPDTLLSNIREVKKYSYYDGRTLSSSDTIWIPSRRELYGALDSQEEGGPEYIMAFPDDDSRSKRKVDYSIPSKWWLRSASSNDDSGFCFVNDDGSSSRIKKADNNYGVAIGFCF